MSEPRHHLVDALNAMALLALGVLLFVAGLFGTAPADTSESTPYRPATAEESAQHALDAQAAELQAAMDAYREGQR